MDTHKMNLLTVKNRLAKHESTLLKIQYVFILVYVLQTDSFRYELW